ncbi:putative membrane protein [Actimicrobium sp. GrIS 1.19]|uniref:DUF2306 domain-containing protein n=1 Tax=Actimicrobium sp. GrIS 1.19 TaxID=3071708 RepID=UPI002DFAB441|nr:putative membrane protein [Actimicrobium sp. GrIS 1.19]
MTNASRTDWNVPLILLAISVIPFAAGIARLAGLPGNPEISTANARFVATPVPVVVHILGAILFPILSVLRLSSGLHQRSPHWHRVSGRVVVASGIFAALTGLWMTILSPIPPDLQGGLLYAGRVVVSVALLLSIFLAVAASKGTDTERHRTLMIRAFALGHGAGMQALLLLLWMLLMGEPSLLHRDLLMGLAWLINLLFAEMAIQRWSPRHSNLYRGTV